MSQRVSLVYVLGRRGEDLLPEVPDGLWENPSRLVALPEDPAEIEPIVKKSRKDWELHVAEDSVDPNSEASVRERLISAIRALNGADAKLGVKLAAAHHRCTPAGCIPGAAHTYAITYDDSCVCSGAAPAEVHYYLNVDFDAS